MRKLLCDLGFHEVWLQQGIGDVGIFLSLLKQRVLDDFRQSWQNELQDLSTAIFCRNNSDFHFQNYPEIITVNKFRTALAKLRLSSHRLEVETVDGLDQTQFIYPNDYVKYVINSKTSTILF